MYAESPQSLRNQIQLPVIRAGMMMAKMNVKGTAMNHLLVFVILDQPTY